MKTKNTFFLYVSLLCFIPFLTFCGTSSKDVDGGLPTHKPECKNDTTRPCYTGPKGTQNKGICKSGVQVCVKETWSKCVQDVTPLPKEICNNDQDDNCDGQIDEGCGCKEGSQKSCYTHPKGCTTSGNSIICTAPCSPGKQTCTQNKWAECKGQINPTTEICNGKDDDCDGKTDNIVELNKKCTVQGKENTPCAAGHWICGGFGQKEKLCKSTYEAQKESCNGKDDDCDGKTDEDLIAPDCTKQDGFCAGLKQKCVQGKWKDCTHAEYKKQDRRYESKETKCNGIDDDCDGAIDNIALTSTPLFERCYTGPKGTEGIGECKGGLRFCSAGQWTECTGQILPTKELRGNHQDEDCDGKALPSIACIDGTVEQSWPGQKMAACDCTSSPCNARTAQKLCAPGWRICNVTDWKKNYQNIDSSKVRFIAAVMRNCHPVSICHCYPGYFDCSTTPSRLEDASDLCLFSCTSNNNKNYHWAFFVGPKKLAGSDHCTSYWTKAHSFVKGTIGRGNSNFILNKSTEQACLDHSYTHGSTHFASGVMCCKQ